MNPEDESVRLAALCQRLGRLCSEQEIETWEEEPTPATVAECRLTLVGKVFTQSPETPPNLLPTVPLLADTEHRTEVPADPIAPPAVKHHSALSETIQHSRQPSLQPGQILSTDLIPVTWIGDHCPCILADLVPTKQSNLPSNPS